MSRLGSLLPTQSMPAALSVDWSWVVLWVAGSLMALALLGSTMRRRRQSLVDQLKQHVDQTLSRRDVADGSRDESE